MEKFIWPRRGQDWGEKLSWIESRLATKRLHVFTRSRNKIRPTIFNDIPTDHPTIRLISNCLWLLPNSMIRISTWTSFPFVMLSARPPTKHFLFRCESRDSRAPNESKINYKAFFMYNEWKSTKLSLKLDRFWRLLAGDFFRCTISFFALLGFSQTIFQPIEFMKVCLRFIQSCDWRLDANSNA